MVKSHVKVAIRTRPTANFASENIEINVDTGKIVLTIPKSESSGVVNNQNDSWKFKFDTILHNSSQEIIFNHCKECVKSVLDGFNGTIMAYGQTGAGKTFTICGGQQNYK